MTNDELASLLEEAARILRGQPENYFNTEKSKQKILLTKKELAEMLSVSEAHIQSLTAGSLLPCVKLGRLVRFDVKKVVAALEKLSLEPWQYRRKVRKVAEIKKREEIRATIRARNPQDRRKGLLARIRAQEDFVRERPDMDIDNLADLAVREGIYATFSTAKQGIERIRSKDK